MSLDDPKVHRLEIVLAIGNGMEEQRLAYLILYGTPDSPILENFRLMEQLKEANKKNIS